MYHEEQLPVYEVEELTIEQAILLMASEEELEQSDFQKPAELFYRLCA